MVDTYISENLLEVEVPELYCKFAVYKMHSKSCSAGTVRLYIHITSTEDHFISDTSSMDLEYSIEGFDTLMSAGMLVDNLTYCFLEAEMLGRGLDKYEH